MCSHFEKPLHTSEDISTVTTWLSHAKVTFSAAGEPKTIVTSMDSGLFIRLTDVDGQNIEAGPIGKIGMSVPDIIKEFPDGTTRLRMAIYKNNPKPVAFDWLREMEKS